MPSDSKRKRKKSLSSNNFLEALRDLGSGMVDSMAHDVVGGVAEEAVDQLTGRKSGELKPNQLLDLEKVGKIKEKGERQVWGFQQEFLSLRRQERLIWNRKEEETKLQITSILEELKKIVNSTSKLTKEVEVAAQQVPVEPGVYHLSFFEKLRQTLILFRKRIEESATWLTAFNQKAKKRNYYWAQVKKSGTKFLLSQERYMATQAG